jgi:hypothetical protein
MSLKRTSVPCSRIRARAVALISSIVAARARSRRGADRWLAAFIGPPCEASQLSIVTDVKPLDK